MVKLWFLCGDFFSRKNMPLPENISVEIPELGKGASTASPNRYARRLGD